MPELAQVKALIPRDLKKRAFIVLAENEQKFTPWLRQQLENLLKQSPQSGEHRVVGERD